MSVYLERQQAGQCVYGTSCTQPLAPGSDLCERHLRRERKRKAKAEIARHERNREKGLCAFCDTPSETYRCLAHAIKHGQTPRMAIGVATAADRAAQIAARTRTHADGRTRYHGQQKRGQQPMAQLNRQDLEMAESAFADFKRAVAVTDTDEFKRMPVIQREAARAAVAGLGDLTCRHIDDVLERLGHFKLRHGKREGE